MGGRFLRYGRNDNPSASEWQKRGNDRRGLLPTSCIPIAIWMRERGVVKSYAEFGGDIQLFANRISGSNLYKKSELAYVNSCIEHLSHNPPPGFKYLLESDKVILTPHIAGWIVESKPRLAEVLVEKILREV